MYIRINQLKLELDEDENNIKKKAAKKLFIDEKNIRQIRILKKSIDGRIKNDIKYSYVIEVELDDKCKINKRVFNNNIMLTKPEKYEFPVRGNKKMNYRPVVTGMGPAGIFCGYFLALKGYRPIIVERGESVDERIISVEKFFKDGILNTESNVQFGEGGAGTFSDGKLNTSIRDDTGRNRLVLETFVKFGANKDITYVNKPHIGTDVLSKIIKNMRQEIIHLGGEVLFSTKLSRLNIKDNRLVSIELTDLKNNRNYTLDTEILVLAPGHSARDTFNMLYEENINMEPKPFAVGVRVEHKQNMINLDRYGEKYINKLPAADYKVTYTTKKGRGVYSFCMCPGGYVVNASSEEKRLVVNGMSYSKRDGENANSAIVVTVKPDDFIGDGPLKGIEFQRRLEEAAYNSCNGKIPIQKYEDFIINKQTNELGDVKPNVKGQYGFGNINNILPEYICLALKEAMPEFGKIIKGFDNKDTLLLAVESRTSSPLRILRNDELMCNVKGIYPCGEGAGYAGGITSAAADGIRVFEGIYKKYGINEESVV